jgi:hypothetical protein
LENGGHGCKQKQQRDAERDERKTNPKNEQGKEGGK